MHQTRVYADAVAAQPKPVAYFLVDAMRYEMGVELVERLPPSTEVDHHARRGCAAVHHACRHGGADARRGRELRRRGLRPASSAAGSTARSCRTSRRAASSRTSSVPGLVDLTLAELLGHEHERSSRPGSAARRSSIVRSQEIDAAGEGGFFQARRTMDTVIDDLARASRS